MNRRQTYYLVMWGIGHLGTLAIAITSTLPTNALLGLLSFQLAATLSAPYAFHSPSPTPSPRS